MIKDWWRDLSNREKIILVIGVIFSLILIFYFLFWSPLKTKVELLRFELDEQQKLVLWMEQAHQLMRTMPQNQLQSITPTSLIGVVEQSLIARQLRPYLNNFSQNDQNKINLTFKSVPFDDFIQWLMFLWQAYQIKAEELTVTPEKKPGIVNVHIVLSLNI